MRTLLSQHLVRAMIACCLFIVILSGSCAQAPTPREQSETIAVTATPTVTPTPIPLTVIPSDSSPPLTTACTRGGLTTIEEVVIGTIYPLTNPTMMLNGFSMQAATNLAVADINAQGGINGKPLRVVSYDSGSSPTQGALFAERLITTDCVAAIVGIFHSNVAQAVKEVAVRYHIPVIFADPYADDITATQDIEVFRIAPTRSLMFEMVGQWLFEVGDYNLDQEHFVVVLTENTQHGQNRLEIIEEIFPRYNLQVQGFTIDLPTDDFSTVIARIVALEMLPDVIFLFLNNGKVFELQQQLLAAGIGPERDTLLVTTPTALDDTQFWQKVPNGNYTIAMRSGPWRSTVTPLGQTFAQKFTQYFQRWPEASAFGAYDSIHLIANAIERADSLRSDAIIVALEQTNTTLASGHYTFPYGSLNRPDDNEVPAYMWHQWPDPQFLFLQYTTKAQPATEATVIWPPTYRLIDTPIVQELMERPVRLGHRR